MHDPSAAKNAVAGAKPGALAYPFDAPELGATVEVAPGVHWVRMPVPFALRYVSAWLLEDGDGWTVVDTGYNTEDIREAWRTVFANTLGGKPLKRMIVTHFHPDHVGLAGWMQDEFGAKLYMPYAEWMTAQLGALATITNVREKWDAFYIANGLPPERVNAKRQQYATTTSPVPQVFRRITHGMEIPIGGRNWRVTTSSGHSPEHASLYSQELGVLISGDQVLPRITTNVAVWYTEPVGNPLGQFMDSFEQFRPLPVDTLVLPSHNRPFYGLHARLEQLTEHHDVRLDAALEACADPRTAFDVLPAIFHRPLDDTQLSFAMGEGLAHLNLLLWKQKLRRFQDEKDGLFRFQRIA